MSTVVQRLRAPIWLAAATLSIGTGIITVVDYSVSSIALSSAARLLPLIVAILTVGYLCAWISDRSRPSVPGDARENQWFYFLVLTVVGVMVPGFLIPALATSRFQLSILLLAALPIMWAGVLFVLYRTTAERVVCYFAFLPAALGGFIAYEQIYTWYAWH